MGGSFVGQQRVGAPRPRRPTHLETFAWRGTGRFRREFQIRLATTNQLQVNRRQKVGVD